MKYNLLEIYNGLLRFNKHILNELAEGLKHLPDGGNKGDSLILGEDGNPVWSSSAIIPTIENAAYGIEWTKNDNDIIRIGNAKFHRELPIQNRLKGCVYDGKKIKYFLNPEGWSKTTEDGIIPIIDGTDGDVGVAMPMRFYIKVIDTGTKYQLWISDYNIDGTWIYIKPFIISHTKSMSRIREDGVEEAFSACLPQTSDIIGGNKNTSFTEKLRGRPRTQISYNQMIELCENRGTGITGIKYLQYCALQTLCYIEYANFDNQAAFNVNLTVDGYKQGGLGAGVTTLNWDRWGVYNNYNPIIYTGWTAEHDIGNRTICNILFALVGYNTDGSNFNVYPSVYRGILNFFGDIWTLFYDVVIINYDTNYNYVYILKEGVKHADVTIDNINEKCYFIGKQANTNNYIQEWDLSHGPYFIPISVDSNKKFDYNWIRGNNGQTTDKSVRVLLAGGSAYNGSEAGSGVFHSGWVRSDSNANVGFFTTIELDD